MKSEKCVRVHIRLHIFHTRHCTPTPHPTPTFATAQPNWKCSYCTWGVPINQFLLLFSCTGMRVSAGFMAGKWGCTWTCYHQAFTTSSCLALQPACAGQAVTDSKHVSSEVFYFPHGHIGSQGSLVCTRSRHNTFHSDPWCKNTVTAKHCHFFFCL